MFSWLTKQEEKMPDVVKEKVVDIGELEKCITDLKKDKENLEKKLRELKQERKIAEEDIKHMVKMKEERMELAHEKKIVETEKKKDDAIAKVKDDYRDKIEKNLEARGTEIKEMYDEILKRLPDVTMHLKGKV